MDKNILEQYDDLRREYEDTKKRIAKTERELQIYDNKYQVQDSVNGGMGGTQHFKIQGFPYPEYYNKRALLTSRRDRLKELESKLAKTLDEVEQFIDSIENSRKRMILKMRYVDSLRWLEIAMKLGPGNTEDSVRVEMSRFLKELEKGAD